MRYCTNCGKELDDNVLFCTGCGTKLEPKPMVAEGSKSADKKTTDKKLDKKNIKLIVLIAIAVIASIFFRTSNAAGMLNLIMYVAIGYAIYRLVKNKKADKQYSNDAEEFVKSHQDVDYYNTLTESTDMKGLYQYGSTLLLYKEHDPEKYERYHRFMTSFVPYDEFENDGFMYAGSNRIYAFFTDEDRKKGNTDNPQLICVCSDGAVGTWLEPDDHVVFKDRIYGNGPLYVRGISSYESTKNLARRLNKVYPNARIGFIDVDGGYIEGLGGGLRKPTNEEWDDYFFREAYKDDTYSVVSFKVVSQN